MTKYIDIPTAARRLNRTPQRVWQMCIAGKFPGATKDKKTGWQIPANADILFTDPAPADALKGLENCPADKREEALRRHGICMAAESFTIHYADVHSDKTRRNDALALFAARQGLKLRTLQRWLSLLRADGLAGLVDTRGRNGGKDIISPAAWQHFKSLYLTPAQKAAALCHKELRLLNEEKKLGWAIPSLRRVQQLVQSIPLPERIFHREGVEAYNQKCAPYIERDLDAYAPGEIWVGDHHQCNVWVRCRDRWVRPWLTAWQDMRSRKLIGWHISIAPNQTTILLAMKRGVLEFGPPAGAKIDNGKDYDSEMWTGTTKARRRAAGKGYLDEQFVRGLYAMMGVSVSFSIPYHPQSKPIERTFDTIDRQFCKSIATYCGKDTDRRPEGLADYLKTDKAIAEAYSLEEFAARLDEYITTVYNRNPHFGAGMLGQSPDAVFATRTLRRVITDEAVSLLLRVWSGRLKVGKNGVRFHGVTYGFGDIDLMQHQGRYVRLTYDPDDVASVQVWAADTMKLITVAECNRLVGHGPVAEDDIRTASRIKARALKAVKAGRDARLVAGYDLTDLALRAQQAAALPAPEEVSPTRLQPVATGLEGQAQMAQRITQRKQLRRAVGSDLDSAPVFDLADLAGGRDEPRYETVFDWNDLSRPAPSAAADEKVFDL